MDGTTSPDDPTQTDAEVAGKITEETILDDDLFQALLSDEWSKSTAQILKQAGETIKQKDIEWTPAFTDDLNEALKDRLNETVNAWLRTVIVREADELRSALLDALSEAIASNIERLSNTLNSEGADGE